MNLQSLVRTLLEQSGLYEDVYEIANYPEGFNIEELKAQPSFAAKARYIRSHGLDKLGAGSSRAVFVADPTTVIKVAKNKKGLEQNKAEANISSNSYDNPFIAKIKDADHDYVWIEAERARKAKPTDFKKIIGFPMEDIMKVIRERGNQLRGNPPGWPTPLSDRNLFNKIIRTDFVTDLLALIINHNLAIGDVLRISSWGVVNRNGTEHLVLIDYGLNMDIFKRLYRL
jgi:hypothetical protein